MADWPAGGMSAITAVVPNWNRGDLLAGLLDRLAAQTCRPQQVVVVDNGSRDGSAELARSKGAQVISMGRNAGFSAAVNRGIRECRTEWIAIINNDVDPAPDFLERLAQAARQPRVWFAKKESGAQAFKGKMTMMPTEDAVDDYNGRKVYSNAFTAYLDGTNNAFQADGVTSNERSVRFDQWLVHHLLGQPYADMPLRIDRASLSQACAIAGIDVDADGVPVQSFENDLKILRWFLLYAANAGNAEKTPAGVPTSFLGYLAAQGVTDITLLTPAQLVALMKEYGLEPGPGFIQPRPDDTD